MSRPMASATAAVSDPALATFRKTSKGWSSPLLLTVTNAVPTGVGMR